jgi:hypothetical protein
MIRHALALVLLGSGSALAAQGMDRHPLLPGGEVVRRGEHYEVHVHFDGAPEAELALEIVETAWPITMRLLGTEGARTSWPLEVHLYANKNDYVVVEKGLTKGQFRDNESFAHWNTRTAHLAMAPPMVPPADESVLLSNQTREILSHEAAHLAVYTVIPTYRWHPTWFGEGLAILVELEVARRRGFLEDPAVHPRFSTDQLIVRRLLERGRFPTAEAIVTDSLERLSSHERYAVWLEFMRVLSSAGNADRFRELVVEMQRARGGPGMRPNIADFMRRTYGMERLDRQLRESVAELAPVWEELYRSLETIGDEWLQAAFPSTDAVAWRLEPVGRAHYVLTGAARPLTGDTRMDVLLGRSETGSLAVSLRASGHLVVTRTPTTGLPVELAHLRADVGGGRDVPFAIEVRHGRLDVTLGDDRAIEGLAVEGLELDGPWGLSVSRGCAGVWKGVRLVD